MCSSEFKDRGVLHVNTVGVKLVFEIRFFVVGSTVELIVKFHVLHIDNKIHPISGAIFPTAAQSVLFETVFSFIICATLIQLVLIVVITDRENRIIRRGKTEFRCK